MIKNYLLVALGNFRKNKLAMCINIIGLAISMAALLAITFFIRNELAYDTAIPDHDRIYRITEVLNSGSYVENSSSLPYPMAEALLHNYPTEVEEAVRVFDFQVPAKSMKLDNDELFNEKAIYYADSNVFHFFEIPLLSGSPEEVLDDPYTMVVSEELGRKWFGANDPVGQTVRLNGQDKLRCTITGVFRQVKPSHFQPQAIISMTTVLTFSPGLKKNWVWNPFWTYVKLKPGIDPANFTAKLPALVANYEVEELRDMMTLYTQPLSSIHLDSHLEFEMSQNSDRKYIYIFLSCAFFLVIVAVVNFVNLTTVTLAARMKEVGVRKVSGATPGQLMSQFILESVMITVMAFILGLLIMLAMHPLLERFVNIDIPLAYLFDPLLVLLFAVVITFTGVVSGLYPALVITRIPITSLFKGGLKGSRKGRIFRKTLVAVQFGIAVVLIVFTLMARKQFNFMQSHDNGYSTDNIITLYIGGTALPGQYEQFRQRLLLDPKVTSVSLMNETIGVTNNNHEWRFGDMVDGEYRYVPTLAVDEHFVKTMGIQLIAGRDYDPDRKMEDSMSVVVNRSLAKYLGYNNPEGALNQRFSSLSGNEYIIGVVEDFNFKSLHNPIGPFVLDVESRNQYNFYYFAKHAVIRVQDTSPQTLEHIKRTWYEFVNNATFDYAMLDNELRVMYERELTMNKVLSIFSLLAIIIACSGLFALTRVLAGMKAKELAIRKVLGADISHLIYVATREQITMVLVAIACGFPLAYWLIGTWMQSFAFRISQDVFAYLAAATIALGIAFFTIFFLAMRAARQDPAPILKCE